MDVENFWNHFNGEPTGQFMSALHKWAKDDNPEEYGKYLTEKINNGNRLNYNHFLENRA